VTLVGKLLSSRLLGRAAAARLRQHSLTSEREGKDLYLEPERRTALWMPNCKETLCRTRYFSHRNFFWGGDGREQYTALHNDGGNLLFQIATWIIARDVSCAAEILDSSLKTTTGSLLRALLTMQPSETLSCFLNEKSS